MVKTRQKYEVPLTFAIHHSDIKIKACCTKISRSFVTRFCAYNRLRYQVGVYRTIGPLFITCIEMRRSVGGLITMLIRYYLVSILLNNLC